MLNSKLLTINVPRYRTCVYRLMLLGLREDLNKFLQHQNIISSAFRVSTPPGRIFLIKRVRFRRLHRCNLDDCKSGSIISDHRRTALNGFVFEGNHLFIYLPIYSKLKSYISRDPRSAALMH